MARDFTTPALTWASTTLWAPLEAGPDGVLHTMRSDASNLQYKRSFDNGVTFEAAVNIATTDSIDSVRLERPLWVDPTTNNVHVMYDRTGVLYHRRSLDGGATWGSESSGLHTLSAGQFYRLGIKGDGAGKVHLVYAAINDGATSPFWEATMYYRRSTDDGATWGSETQPYTTGSYTSRSRPNLAVNGSTVHLCWAATITGEPILTVEEVHHGRSTDAGVTWEAVNVMAGGIGTKFAHRPEMMTCGNGSTLLYLWQEGFSDSGTTADVVVWQRRSTDDGDTFDAARQLTQRGSGLGSEHAWLDSVGNKVALVYQDKETLGTEHASLLLSEDAGANWVGPQTVSATVQAFAPVTTLANGYIHVSLNTESPNEIYQARAPWGSLVFRVATGLDDGYVTRESSAPGEWPVTGGFFVGDTATNAMVRKAQLTGLGFSDCTVLLIRFDTSAIPDNAVITSATLRLQTIAKGAATGRDIQVGYYASSNWPIDSADWSGADNPGSDAGTFPISNFVVGTPEDLVLSSPTSVSKTGYTGLRLSVSGAEPNSEDDHRVEFAALEHATIVEPQLIVTFDEQPVAVNPAYDDFPLYLPAGRSTVYA
jgi:hypothetical protein